MALEPGLYVAATPIGNLKDVTFRVIETLKEADQILCEDTRQTAKLCAAYGIETPRAPYHDHNADRVRPGIIKKLQEGAAICLACDAGTPLISDPGYKLVRDARQAGVRVTPLPGPSALIAALSASAAPTDQFLFAGFPPPRAAARAKFFRGLAEIDATLVFYESPSRLADSLAAMVEALGDRGAVVAREVTKLHEEFRDDRLSRLAAFYAQTPPKGEIVVIVRPPLRQPAAVEEIDAFLEKAMGEMSLKDAVAAAVESFGAPRREAYARALALKGRR